jgi:hypothetical protein
MMQCKMDRDILATFMNNVYQTGGNSTDRYPGAPPATMLLNMISSSAAGHALMELLVPIRNAPLARR